MDILSKDSNLVIISLILTLIFVYAYQSRELDSWEDYEYEVINYEIKAGDTLWQIAKAHKPDGLAIREYVYYLRKLNENRVNLRIGHEIKVYQIKVYQINSENSIN